MLDKSEKRRESFYVDIIDAEAEKCWQKSIKTLETFFSFFIFVAGCLDVAVKIRCILRKPPLMLPLKLPFLVTYVKIKHFIIF